MTRHISYQLSADMLYDNNSTQCARHVIYSERSLVPDMSTFTFAFLLNLAALCVSAQSAEYEAMRRELEILKAETMKGFGQQKQEIAKLQVGPTNFFLEKIQHCFQPF